MNVQKTLNEMAKDLYSVGAIDKAVFDRLNSDSLDYSPHQIVSLRKTKHN